MLHVYFTYFSRWRVFLLRNESPSEDCVVYRADGYIRLTDQNTRLKTLIKELGIQSTNSTQKIDIEDFLQKVRLPFPPTSTPLLANLLILTSSNTKTPTIKSISQPYHYHHHPQIPFLFLLFSQTKVTETLQTNCPVSTT
jgi:hypothetical protein